MKDPFSTKIVLETTRNNDFPEECMSEVRRIWEEFELGNDTHYLTITQDSLEEGGYPKLFLLLKQWNIEKCLLHFWW